MEKTPGTKVTEKSLHTIKQHEREQEGGFCGIKTLRKSRKAETVGKKEKSERSKLIPVSELAELASVLSVPSPPYHLTYEMMDNSATCRCGHGRNTMHTFHIQSAVLHELLLK